MGEKAKADVGKCELPAISVAQLCDYMHGARGFARLGREAAQARAGICPGGRSAAVLRRHGAVRVPRA